VNSLDGDTSNLGHKPNELNAKVEVDGLQAGENLSIEVGAAIRWCERGINRMGRVNSQLNNGGQEAANADVDGQEEELEDNVNLSPERKANFNTELDGKLSTDFDNGLWKVI
jgi:hypothetical protein